MNRAIATKLRASVPTHPFPGLRPFREDEEYLFFGRENQVDAMVNKLTATRFLAVVGTSGSGKSSLVNCGLRPALHGGLMACAGTAWRMAQFRPGSEPMRAMARALAKDGVLFRDYQAGGLTLAEIVDTTLRMSKLGLIDIYEQANLGEEVNLLVVVDQFEELFRYRQLEAGQQNNVCNATETAAAFVNLLLEAKAQTTYPIYVVLTMRSDFLGDCSQFPGLAEAINAGQYLVPRMNRDERREAISGPVAVGGAEISPVLLTRLVNDVGDNPDQLSILQHALNRTWARWQNDGGGDGPLDLPHYEAIGTMARALDQHAERAYAELGTMRQQQICERLFKALTDKATDPRGVRRPTTLGTLCALADATAAEVTAVIDVFRKPSRSFLMPPAGEALETETVIDISHESLMRVWQRLITWADEEAQSAQMYRRLADAAARHAVGKASLWRDPDLQLALDWRDQNQPNETWASRYGSGFDEARAFLRDSEAAHAVELDREKERQQADAERMAQERELEQTRALAEAQRHRADDQVAARIRQRRLMWGLVVVAGLAVGAAGFGQTQKREAERQTKIAAANAQEATQSAQRATESAAIAKQQTEIAEQRSSELDLQRELAVKNENRAVEESRVARSSEVAAKSEYQLAVDPELSLLLAMEAASIAPRQGLYALRRALPGLRVLRKTMTAGGAIHTVAYSPDGELIATAVEDGTVRIWNADSGEVVSALKGHTKAVHLLVFSPDGRRVATEASDETGKVWDRASSRELFTMEGLTGKYAALAFSPDGARIAAENGKAEASVWDVETRTKLYTVQHTGAKQDNTSRAIRMVVFSPNGKLLVTASDDTTARVWDSFNGKLITTLSGHRKAVVAAAFSLDGKRIVTASLDGTAQIFETGNWENNATRLDHKEEPIYDVRVSRDNKIVTASADRTARIWDFDGRMLQELAGHNGPVTSAAFSPDGQFVVTASGLDQGRRAERRDVMVTALDQAGYPSDDQRVHGDNRARVWNVESGRQVVQFRGHTGAMTSIAFSPDGRSVATAARDGTVRIWATGIQNGVYVGNGVDLGPLLAGDAAFSRDGKLIIAPGPGNSAVIKDSSTGEVLRQWGEHSNTVNRVAFGPNDTALTVDESGNWLVRDWKSGKVLGKGTGAQAAAAFGRAEGLVVTASAGKDAAVRVWNHDRLLGTLPREGRVIRRVALSPNARLVVVVYGRDKADSDRTVTLWDYARKSTVELSGHAKRVYSAEFSRDGNLMVTASADNTALVWDTNSGKPIGKFEHADEVNRASFNPRGDMIATTGDDNTARLWTWPKGKTLILRGHDGPVYDAIFSFDGRFLLTASKDRSAKIWDTATGELVETFSNLVNPTPYVDSVSLSPQGTRVMTSSREGGIRVYPCELCGSLDELKSLAKMRVPRQLTAAERERYLPASGGR